MNKENEEIIERFKQAFDGFIKDVEGKKITVANVKPEIYGYFDIGVEWGRSITFEVEYEADVIVGGTNETA